MKGRKPTPSNLKLLRGNPGQRPINRKEPKPRGAVRCPSWLDGYAKAEWRRQAPELLRLGLLTGLDEPLFSLFCVAVGEARTAWESIKKDGRVYESGNLTKANPAVNQLKGFMVEARALGASFGLTPADRGRLEVRTEDDDDLDDLLFGPDRR